MMLRLVLFFTHGIALQTWEQQGMFDREVALYRRLQARGVHVSFVTYGHAEDLRFRERLPGIDILCNRFGWSPPVYWRWLKALYAPTLARAHVIKTNQTQGADIALSAARWWRKPLVARCGYMWSEFVANQHGADSEAARRAYDLEARVFRAAQRVVVTTPMMAEDVARRLPEVIEKTQVIPNFVDTDRFAPDPDAVPDFDVMIVGRLSPQKNVPALLEAVRGTSLRTLIIGNGEQAPEVEHAVAASDGRLTWLPQVPHYALPGYLARARVYVLPSLYEGHPKTLIEAMACGAAVIGARVPGIQEVLRHGETGWLCGTGAAEIRQAITTLCAQPAMRAELGTAARRFAIEQYSLDHIVETELALLQTVAAADRGHRE